MHVEGRISNMGVDCDALPSTKPISPKRPLSKSLRRSASNRAIKTGPDRSQSLLNQAILRRSSSSEFPKPKPSTPPRPSFSSSPSAPSLPPLPAVRSKHLARSLTFSSLQDPDTEPNAKHRHAEPLGKPEKPPPAAPTSSVASETVPVVAETDSEPPKKDAVGEQQNGSEPLSEGPAVFVKSFFRSSTFSALRARSFRSRPAAEEVMEIPESSPYSLLSGPPSENKRASHRVSPIVEIENSLGVLTKGLLDSSRNAVKAVQDKARHLVNKRYQDGGFQLDMVYITENIIAMGFPGNDSGPDILGFKEGNYRDSIEELVTFCETQHPGKYKVFNLCSEKLYDTSLLHDKVAFFPFEGHSCPPLMLVTAFCEAASAWLRAGLENVAVVHCKRGLARTGLMISCLLLHLKFFPTAEESMSHYNLKRCVDGKGLNIPSQLRYVKYYEQVLKKHQGFTPTGRRCTLRSIRLVNCPSWIRPAVTVLDHDGVLFTSKKHPKTRSMLAEDVWLSAVKSGVLLFEMPEDGHAAAVDGDFKIHFQDRNVNFSCWLNTNMVGVGNIVLRVNDLDGYEKGLQEATGFQVELELLDTYLSVLKVAGTADSAPTITRPCLPSPDMASGPTSSCTDAATDGEITVFTDGEEEEEHQEEGTPATAARPSTSQPWSWDPTNATANQTPFQMALSNAVTEVSTGFLNAIDRFSLTQHLRMSHVRSSASSLPNSPRTTSSAAADYHHHHHESGSACSADSSDSITAAGASRFRSSKQVLQKQFTYDFDAEDESRAHVVTRLSSASSALDCDIVSRELEDHVDLRFGDSGPESDFRALAAASAADASLFTFGDDEDYASDEA